MGKSVEVISRPTIMAKLKERYEKMIKNTGRNTRKGTNCLYFPVIVTPGSSIHTYDIIGRNTWDLEDKCKIGKCVKNVN